MFTFEIDKETVQRFADRFGSDRKKKIKDALAAVRQEWQQEFVRQDVRMQKQWRPLKTWVTHRGSRSRQKAPARIDPDSYFARKQSAYRVGRNNNTGEGGVFFLRILKRSGVMLDRYINGIRVNNTSLVVTIPYPKSPSVNMRAKVHQGAPGYKLPYGVLARRPYDLERFKLVADREIRRALNK